MSQSVRVTVPASTSNLGPGFDTLGLALNLRNELLLQATGSKRGDAESAVCVSIEGRGEGQLPTNAQNVAVKAAKFVFRAAGYIPERLHFRLINRIPLCSGLGSSASAIVAGLAAANAICDGPFTLEQLLTMATALEGHPDNAAPALLGGLTICVLDEAGRVQVVQPRVRNDLQFLFCVPSVELPTKRARKALPKSYKREDVVFSLSRAVMLTALLHGGSTRLLRAAMHDRIHQPYRAPLVPGLAEALEAAEGAGALGACISGSGPTVLAITDRSVSQENVGKAMARAFSARGISSEILPLGVSRFGVRVYNA
jgi:homoserine kinase